MNLLQLITRIWNREQIAELELEATIAQVDLEMRQAIKRELTRIAIEAELRANPSLEVSQFYKRG